MPEPTGDTLTDIHASVGDLLNADVPESLLDDEAIDAELDAKASKGEPVEAEEPDAPDAEEAEPEATDEEAEAESEPVAEEPTAAPFAYTVNGEAKSYPGGEILTAKDGSVIGARFTGEQVKDLQYRIQRGEYLETQNKALYEKARDIDAIRVTDRATNAEHSGMAAVEHLVVENARQHAALALMAEHLENPEKLIALAYAVQNGDRSPLDALTERLRLIAENATYKTRTQFGQRLSQAKAEQEQATSRASETPTMIQQAVEHWAGSYPALTAEDKKDAVAYLTKVGSTIVRPATPDEAAAAGVKPGDLIFDHPVVAEYLSRIAALRQQAATVSTTATQAAKENAARLAATKPAAKRSPATKPKAKVTVPSDTEESWSQQRARMLNGQFATSDDE